MGATVNEILRVRRMMDQTSGTGRRSRAQGRLPEHSGRMERPILFSGEMIRALLAERKTQTRRVASRAMNEVGEWADAMYPDGSGKGWIAWWGKGPFSAEDTARRYPGNEGFRAPYWPGLKLWVRETVAIERCYEADSDREPTFTDGRPVLRMENDRDGHWWEQPHYRATDPAPDLCCEDDKCRPCSEGDPAPHWTPSIFMPRWASRITLDVVSVRVERVQEITEEDAEAEGIPFDGTYWRSVVHPIKGTLKCWPTARMAYEKLWDELNAKPKPVMRRGKIERYVSYPWAAIRETREHRGKPWEVMGNPMVWVLGFEKRDAHGENE